MPPSPPAASSRRARPAPTRSSAAVAAATSPTRRPSSWSLRRRTSSASRPAPDSVALDAGANHTFTAPGACRRHHHLRRGHLDCDRRRHRCRWRAHGRQCRRQVSGRRHQVLRHHGGHCGRDRHRLGPSRHDAAGARADAGFGDPQACFGVPGQQRHPEVHGVRPQQRGRQRRRRRDLRRQRRHHQLDRPLHRGEHGRNVPRRRGGERDLRYLGRQRLGARTLADAGWAPGCRSAPIAS